MTSSEESTVEKPLTPAASTGIRMVSIFVDRIDYSLNLAHEEKLGRACYEVEILSERQIDLPYGFVRLTVSCRSITQGAQGHNLNARLIGSFKQIGESTSVPFEKYLGLNAPASMFAFARELIFTITSRSPIQPILLDPVNMLELMKSGSLKYTIPPEEVD